MVFAHSSYSISGESVRLGVQGVLSHMCLLLVVFKVSVVYNNVKTNIPAAIHIIGMTDVGDGGSFPCGVSQIPIRTGTGSRQVIY